MKIKNFGFTIIEGLVALSFVGVVIIAATRVAQLKRARKEGFREPPVISIAMSKLITDLSVNNQCLKLVNNISSKFSAKKKDELEILLEKVSDESVSVDVSRFFLSRKDDNKTNKGVFELGLRFKYQNELGSKQYFNKKIQLYLEKSKTGEYIKCLPLTDSSMKLAYIKVCFDMGGMLEMDMSSEFYGKCRFQFDLYLGLHSSAQCENIGGKVVNKNMKRLCFFEKSSNELKHISGWNKYSHESKELYY